MSMESIGGIVNSLKDPGAQFVEDLKDIHGILKDRTADERHKVFVAIVELGYRIRDAQGIQSVINFLESSYDLGDEERSDAYKMLGEKMFGGVSNV